MGARDLSLDEATHVYRLAGKVVPSVTGILRPLANFEGIPKHVLEAKADLGRRVHFACQLDDEDDLDEDTVEPEVAPYLDAWRLFLRESGAGVLMNEQKVFEPELRYAGTLDNVLELRGSKWVVDKKTSFTVPASAGPQTAAYLRAAGDPSITHRAAVRLRADGTYRFDALSGANDWSVFMACLCLHRFKEENRYVD